MISDNDTESNSQLIVMTCSRSHQEAGDFLTFTFYQVLVEVLVYWWDCPLSPGRNVVLSYRTAKRNSGTQKRRIET